MKPRPVDVLKFSDYRTFLVAHAQKMKLRRPSWSLGTWALALNLKATSSLTKILNGERNPGSEMTSKLIKYFAFAPEEEQHFLDLVHLQKLKKNPQLSAVLLEKIAKRGQVHAYSLVDPATFSALSDWYCYAIREMVNLNDFMDDPAWISKRLRFSVSRMEARRAIEKLLSCGLLVRDDRGRLQLGAQHIDTNNDVACEAIRNYHAQSFENAKRAVYSVPVNRRECTSTTFTFCTRDIDDAKAFIRAFRKNFASRFEKTDGEEVYQLEMTFFPVTKALKEKKDDGISNPALH